MKKLLSICLVMALVLTMSISASAALGGFMSSPSGKPAPTIVTFDPKDEDCTARLVIVPYADRTQLSGFLLELFEKAYNDILNCTDLTKLNADLAKLVAKLKIAPSKLAVSDLFDIHVEGCDYHEEHKDFDIVLSADTLNRFVGLLHMNKLGEWVLVDNAKVSEDGEHLMFSVEDFSPFAVVVDTTDITDAPATGDDSMTFVYAIIAVVSALALVAVILKIRKNKSL